MPWWLVEMVLMVICLACGGLFLGSAFFSVSGGDFERAVLSGLGLLLVAVAYLLADVASKGD